jgi:hypothetical protein
MNPYSREKKNRGMKEGEIKKSQYWMGKYGPKGLLTPKPVRLYYDNVFDHYWASKGPGDHCEGYEGPGITKGPFGRWTSFVSDDKAEVADWLAKKAATIAKFLKDMKDG